MEDPNLQARDPGRASSARSICLRPDGARRRSVGKRRRLRLASLAAVMIVGACTTPSAGVEAGHADPRRHEVSSPAGTTGTTDAVANIRAMRDAGVPIRILPLGDSITQCGATRGSYRYYLWIKLVETGIDFDFVGSLNSSGGIKPDRPAYYDRSFDPDHEGHPGWSADHILHGLPGNKSQKLSEWLKAYTPDIALVHLGSNDAGHSESTTGTASELKQIIQVLRDDNPNVIVLLAKLIPSAHSPTNVRIDELNERMDAIAKEMSAAASPVIVVDQSSGFDAETDTYDGTHPNMSGERKMADKWFEALKGVFGI